MRWGCDVVVPLLGISLLEVLQWHCSFAALIVGGSALGVGSVLWPSGNSLEWPLDSGMLPWTGCGIDGAKRSLKSFIFHKFNHSAQMR